MRLKSECVGLGWRWCALLAALLAAAFYFDISVLRFYYNLSLPGWLWGVEHVISKYSHLTAIGIGLVLLGWGGAKRFWHGVGVLAISSFVVMLLKFGIGRVRPGNAGDPFLFFGINGVHDSYPSGHTVAIWAIVFVLLRFSRRLGLVWVVVGVVVAWARLHAQAHYLSDLMAGGLVALACERILWWRFHLNHHAVGEGDGPVHRRVGWSAWLRQVAPWLVVILLPVLVVLPMRTPVSAKRSTAEYDLLIHGIYERLMMREVDAAALALWREELPKRRVVSDILFQFAVSREFSDSVHSEGVTAEARVETVYGRLLDRAPTENELKRGVVLLESLDNPPQHRYGVRLLAIRLILSAEYLERYGAFVLPGDPAWP